MDTYTLTEDFELQALWHLILSPGMGRYLKYLEDVYFRSTITKRIGRVLKAFGVETNAVPGSFEVFLQRVSREVNQGSMEPVVRDDIETFVFCRLLPLPAGKLRGVENELGAIIRARAQVQALDTAVKASGRRGNKLALFAKQIIDAEQIGVVAAPLRVIRSLRDMRQVMSEQGDLKRLSTGSYITDNLMEGGLPINTMGMILASTNSGKSALTAQLLAACIIMGGNANLVTLEGVEREPVTKVMALLSGMTIDYVRKYTDEAMKEAERRWPGLGQLAICRVEATGSTAAQIIDVVQGEEEARGIKFDLNVWDYFDLIEGSDVALSKLSGYEKSKVIGQYIHSWVDTSNTRLWTPIQSKRLQKLIIKGIEQDQNLDLNDGADSQHKVRIADIVLALNRKKSPPSSVYEGSSIPVNGDMYLEAVLLKHRQGQAGLRSEVFRTQMDRAVLIPDDRFFPAWEEPVGNA